MALNQVKLKQLNEMVLFTPSKVVCVGRNYVEHIHELGNDVPDEMVVFVKPNSAITDILMSHVGETLHYEAELCFMVKNGQFSAVGVGLDLTKRELQTKLKKQGLPWERAKAFDGSATFSEFIPIVSNTQDWCFQLTIDQVVIQLGHQQLMSYQPQAIFDDISQFMTLNDGDIVMTGTPKGVGEINVGSLFSLSLWQGIEYSTQNKLINDVGSTLPLLTQQWQAV